MADKGVALGWDDEGQAADSSFEILPEGEYDFEVTNFKRERFDGNDNMAACPQAAIQLKCIGEKATGTTFERIRLNSRMMWQITAFFKSCGLIPADTPEGANISMSLFNQCVGCRGRCKITIRKYEYNGEKREANNVTFLVPKTQPQPTQQPQPAYQYQQQTAPHPSYQPPQQQAQQQSWSGQGWN